MTESSKNFDFKHKLERYIRDLDIFGYFVSFNFNQDGDHHKTRVGGAMTILLRSFMLWYVIKITKKMIYYEEDLVENRIINVSETDAVELKDTFFMQYHQLQKVGSGYAVDVFYNQSTKQYIRATYS